MYYSFKSLVVFSFKSLVVLLLVGTVATGCASSPLSPINPSGSEGSTALTAGQIAGTWTLSSMQPAGEAEQSAPAGATYALVLADGHASTTADCNVCGGNLVVDGQTLTVGPLIACTRAACPTMAFENRTSQSFPAPAPRGPTPTPSRSPRLAACSLPPLTSGRATSDGSGERSPVSDSADVHKFQRASVPENGGMESTIPFFSHA